jgi:hypothetical protein
MLVKCRGTRISVTIEMIIARSNHMTEDHDQDIASIARAMYEAFRDRQRALAERLLDGVFVPKTED